MQINYDLIPSGKVRSIILKADKVAQSLHDDGRHPQAAAIEDLIRSRIASHSENSQINKLYREAFAARTRPDVSAEVKQVLQPFANFMAKGAPPDHVITSGSPFAQQQLTVADCEKARAFIARLDNAGAGS